MTTKLRRGDRVRLVSGRTEDTEHVHGGDLAGVEAEVISDQAVMPGPADANGNTNPEERVVLATLDGPRNAGIIDAPVRRLERVVPAARRAYAGGFGDGTMKKQGIRDIRTVTRGSKRFVRTRYDDGRETYDPLE